MFMRTHAAGNICMNISLEWLYADDVDDDAGDFLKSPSSKTKDEEMQQQQQ